MLSANDFSKKQIIFMFPKEGDKLTFSNDNIVVKDKAGKVLKLHKEKSMNSLT